ncbi:MAG TPA: carboxypeptidase-like regulatory domain-containing protein [Terracidiphilus sp.]|nr:carboxypeptidase-like regulatory domain-containing protein [Terracidiphilus sp.]
MQNPGFCNFTRNAFRATILFTLLGLTILPVNPVFSQSSSSGINGVVTDPSGAAVSGAKVTLRNADTNVERDTVSNGSGNYFFGNVPPARYTLTFTARTFQTETISAFDVGVAQVVTLNASLKVGEVEQSVTVTATNTEVESSTAQLGSVIGTHSVNDLPLNGRNFTQLLDLTPGVTPISTGQNSSGSNTAKVAGSTYNFPSINGAYNRSTLYMVDGLNDNQAWYNTYAVPPIIDTVQEFKINSHSEAQYGGVIGGVVNIASKSGTNNYHGSSWEFVRASSFDANPYFSAPGSYHLNIFGGQMGGPVTIPHLYNGRNKTFIEIGFEGTRFSQAGSNNILIPTAAQLGEATFGGPQTMTYADFSSNSTGVAGGCVAGATSASTGACQLYDPTIANDAPIPNRPAYLGNQVPVSEFNKSSMALINAVFGKNGPIVIPGISSYNKNFQITDPTRQSVYNYTGRIDQHIGTRDFFFFRYAGFQSTQTSPSTLPTLFSTTIIPAQQYGVSWNHVFNSTTSMQVQYGNTHVEDDALTQFKNHNMWQTYGCSTDMCNDFVGGAAILITQTVTNGFGGGEVNSPSSNLSSVHEWSGSVIKVIGNHQLQAGGGWDEDNYTAELRQGAVNFTGGSTANFAANPSSPAGITSKQISAQSGFGLVDYLLDYPNNENKRNVLLTERPGGIGSIYMQDSWKMNPKLTVNYGIRYDRSVIPAFGTDASIGLQGSIETGDFDFTNGNYIIQKLPPLCSVRNHAPCLPSATLPAHVVVASGTKIMHGSKANFGPRFGFAYRVNNGLSVRGGFGIFFDNWSALIQMPQNYQGSWPDTGTLQINSTNTPGTVYTSAQDPFAQNGGNLPAATPFTSSNVNYMVSPYWKNPYSEQFNLGIEKEIGFNSILSVNYVGSVTHRMDVGGYYNTGTPCGSGCTYASFATRVAAGVGGQPYPYTVPEKSWDHAGANGSYNALQVALQRSFSSGLSYMVSYTWSKTLDEGGDGFFGVEGGVPEDPYNPRGSRGPASFNIPQMLSTNFVYVLPVGTGKRFSTGNHVADYVIGNWQVNGIFIARTGQDFNVVAGGDIAETGNAGTYERANLVGDPYQSGPISANPTCTPPAGAVHTRSQWFNPCAFQAPAIGTLGNNGRNSLHGQDYWDLDPSVSRVFPIHESLSFNIKVDAFNVLNHPVLGNPGATVTTPSTFGQITGTASSQRILQFSGKLSF